MARKVIALVTAGALVFASAAIATSYELRGDFGKAHPDSRVTAEVQVRGGVPTRVKTFEFRGLLAECADGSEVEVSGELGRPAELVEKGARFKFEAKLVDGGSKAEVRGRVSPTGKAATGTIAYSGKVAGGCEVEARFELER